MRSMRGWFLIVLPLCVTSLGTGCASGGASPQGAKGETTSPRLVGTARLPTLRITTSGVSPTVTGPPTLLTIDVFVDEQGKPDLSTFQVTGRAAAENRQVLEEWMQQQTFEPATKNGKPVRGRFRMTLKI